MQASKKMFREDKECMCTRHQVEMMKASGWKETAEEAAAAMEPSEPSDPDVEHEDE